jgi:hypothetical protein
MPRRARRWILGALALLVALGTLSYTPGVTLQFADERGAPAADAYVRYHYHGSLLNPVHPVTYVARGSVIARADALGFPLACMSGARFPCLCRRLSSSITHTCRDCTTRSVP